MSKSLPTHSNRLKLYRKRLGLSQKRVALLLGYKDTSTISRFERGAALPPLSTALGLGAILRVPLEFIWYDSYQQLRSDIRQQEETLDGRGQQTLF